VSVAFFVIIQIKTKKKKIGGFIEIAERKVIERSVISGNCLNFFSTQDEEKFISVPSYCLSLLLKILNVTLNFQ
jgi:hypothetical protein